MKKKAILAYNGRKPKKRVEYTLIAEDVELGKEKHLIVDLYNYKELIYRIAINDNDFEHYDYKDKKWETKTRYNNPYRHEIGIAYITNEDYSRIKNHNENVKKEKYTTSNADVVFGIEGEILSKKEKIKEAREDAEQEELFQLIPDEPETFEKSIQSHIDEYNIIYYKRTGKRADYFCCQCGNEFQRRFYEPDEMDMQFDCHAYIPIPRKESKDKCDCCGKTATLMQMGYAKIKMQLFEIILYQTAADGTLIAREYSISATRSAIGQMSVTKRERGRAFMKRGKVRAYRRYYGANSWHKSRTISLEPCEPVYDVDYDKQVGKSDLRYIPKDMHKLIQGSPAKKAEPGKSRLYALMSYAKAPQLETLYKIGLTTICKHLLWVNGSSRAIDKKAKDAAGILRISKPELRYLVENTKYGNDVELLKLIKFAKKNNISLDKLDKLKEMAKYQPEQINLEYCLKFQSFDKLYNLMNKYCQDYRSMNETLREYTDYLKERQANGDDLTNTVYLRPRSLHETYTRLRLEAEQKRDTEYIGKMLKKYPDIAKYSKALPKKYTYHQAGLLIRPAKDAKEIVLEGRILHHCVGSDAQRYMKNFNENKAYILLVRKETAPDEPYATVEIRDRRIIQWYQEHDRQPDKEIIESFLDNYIEHLKERTRVKTA